MMGLGTRSSGCKAKRQSQKNPLKNRLSFSALRGRAGGFTMVATFMTWVAPAASNHLR